MFDLEEQKMQHYLKLIEHMDNAVATSATETHYAAQTLHQEFAGISKEAIAPETRAGFVIAMRQLKRMGTSIPGLPYKQMWAESRTPILSALETLSPTPTRETTARDERNIHEPVPYSQVFVVHGRNSAARDAMFAFLRAIGLCPIEWSQAIKMTGKPSPFVGEILQTAFANAQAVVVLMTPDDIAFLRKEFLTPKDKNYEREPTPQCRPNVLFEAGMAMGRNEDRTILVQIGEIRPFSDIGGRHVVCLDNTTQRRQDLAERLQSARCAVNLSGRDWHTAGDFEACLPSSLDDTMGYTNTSGTSGHNPHGPPPSAYVSAHGVLWKRAGQGFEDIAYCPTCSLAMAAFPPGSNEMLVCSKCHFIAPFRPNAMPEKVATLT